MKHNYSDITSKIDEPPLWWDEAGVPRYCEFSPQVTANIYADEAVLLLVRCQACEREFRVCVSLDDMTRACAAATDLAVLIRRHEIEYGDPPNVDCCPAGPTMNSVPVRVLEYWHRVDHEWVRDAELERPVECDWAAEDML